MELDCAPRLNSSMRPHACHRSKDFGIACGPVVASPRRHGVLRVSKPRIRASTIPTRKIICDLFFTDPQTDVALGVTQSRNMRSRYRCSMCPAIHINSRSWLRSSSTHEPSDPPPRVVFLFSLPFFLRSKALKYKALTPSRWQRHRLAL